MRNQASPGKRFMAALIDGVLCWGASLVPVVGIAAAVIYAFIKDALPLLDGQSIGKKAMRIRAVMEATGKPMGGEYVAAILRQVSLFIPVFGIVDAFMVFSADRRRFGDRWAGTVVVEDETT